MNNTIVEKILIDDETPETKAAVERVRQENNLKSYRDTHSLEENKKSGLCGSCIIY